MEENIPKDILQTKKAEDDKPEQEQQQEQQQEPEPEQPHEPACDAEPTEEAEQHEGDAPAPAAPPPQQPQAAHCHELHTTGHARHAVGHHSSSGSGGKGGLTFSGPPYVPKAKHYARADYSHSSNRLIKITHDNQLLVDRLMSISHKEPDWVKQQQNAAPCNTASSAVNRRKQATTVAQENHALYQRLVAIRPSKDISRETLEAEHRRNELYRTNCAAFKPAHETV